MHPNGLVTLPSRYDPEETSRRLVAALEKRDIMIFNRIDQVTLARTAGLELRPTEVFFVGNPHAGGPLMQDVQTIGIDLPLRVLVWRDETQKTWLSYNDPMLIAHRFRPSDASRGILTAMSKVVSEVAHEVTGGDSA